MTFEVGAMNATVAALCNFGSVRGEDDNRAAFPCAVWDGMIPGGGGGG